MAFWYGSRLVIKGELQGADVMVVFFAMLMGAMVCRVIIICSSINELLKGTYCSSYIHAISGSRIGCCL